jgi:hypothetical protein
MFNFKVEVDKFGYTQATMEDGEVFYYVDFLVTEDKLMILSDSWIDHDKPKTAQLHLAATFEMIY